MGVYDNPRSVPAYSEWTVHAECGENKHILKWWSPAHDQVLAKLIMRERWGWPWHIPRAIQTMTPEHEEDSLDGHSVPDNTLMCFAIARAAQLGISKQYRAPEWKTCPMCGEEFIESSLPQPLIERLGPQQIDFCTPCLKGCVLQGAGNPSMERVEVLQYLRDLSAALGRVPHQNYGEGMDDLLGFTTDERLAILRALARKPTVGRVKELFGSWLAALIETGLLDQGTWRPSMGTYCIARDGHQCHSLAEKTIDDFLSAHSIRHIREPLYPDQSHRGDFLVRDFMIEYFGLHGHADYDAKTEMKKRMCRQHGLRLIAIWPADLAGAGHLERKLASMLESEAEPEDTMDDHQLPTLVTAPVH